MEQKEQALEPEQPPVPVKVRTLRLEPLEERQPTNVAWGE